VFNETIDLSIHLVVDAALSIALQWKAFMVI